jgi:hypothetical protein
MSLPAGPTSLKWLPNTSQLAKLHTLTIRNILLDLPSSLSLSADPYVLAFKLL